MKNFEVTFLGTSGSVAFNAEAGKRSKYGTNTACIAVEAGCETLIFDAGTGLCGFKSPSEHIRLFLSHYHVDHIGGLLFLPDFFNRDKKIDLYGSSSEGVSFKTIIEKFLSPPLHPVGTEVFRAQLTFNEIKAGDIVYLSDGVTVRTTKLMHQPSCLGYRVDYNNKSLCYLSDVGLCEHEGDTELLEFLQDTDLLVLDSFFDDGKAIPGWGHSTWRECAEWAKKCSVKKLALFHHDFKLSDSEIDMRTEKAREVFPNTFAAADFMKVEI